MKVLDLVVKHKWYDMEESGEKPEEYRVLSDHWVKRFLRIDTGRESFIAINFFKKRENFLLKIKQRHLIGLRQFSEKSQIIHQINGVGSV